MSDAEGTQPATDAAALVQRLAAIREALAEGARRAGRAADAVRLVAVSKTHPAEAIRVALAASQQDFGENYAQELRDKHVELHGATTPSGAPLHWHFIGPVQSNKVKYLVGVATLIHGVASASAVDEIERRAAAQGCVQDCLIQVNVVQEPGKQGVPPTELGKMLDGFAGKKHVRCRGLMLIPPFSDDPEDSRRPFAALRELATREQAQSRENVELVELSMGMSGDYLVAVEEGATLVRVGTAIFGARP